MIGTTYRSWSEKLVSADCGQPPYSRDDDGEMAQWVKKMLHIFILLFILQLLTASWLVAYFIAFGPHGPRAEPPPGIGWWYAKWTTAAFALACVLLVIIRSFAGPPPSTMNKEWQEATNEYLKVIFTISH